MCGYIAYNLEKMRLKTNYWSKRREMDQTFNSKTVEKKVKALIEVAKTCVDHIQGNALQELWILSNNDKYKKPLCHPSYDLLPTLKTILEIGNNIIIRTKVTGILWLLSRDDDCILEIASPSYNLLPLLMNVLKNADPVFEYRIHLITVINNMCLVASTHSLLLRPELDWLSYWKEQILQETDYYQWYRAMANFTQSGTQKNVEMIILYDFHRIIIKKFISFDANPERWGDDRYGGIPYWCLTFAANLSSLPAGKKSIRQLNDLNYFLQLMKYPTLEGVRATIFVANVYGQDENNYSTNAILKHYPTRLTLLLDILQVTIDYDEDSDLAMQLIAEGFSYGTFKLRTVLSALKSLAMSSENKEVIVQNERIILLSLKLIEDFLANAPEYSAYVAYATERAGGGGKDTESIEHVLEMLLELSFYFDGENGRTFDNLQNFFLVKSSNILTMLQQFSHIPDSRFISSKPKQYAAILLNNLEIKFENL